LIACVVKRQLRRNIDRLIRNIVYGLNAQEMVSIVREIIVAVRSAERCGKRYELSPFAPPNVAENATIAERSATIRH
jgi:hypothetical protein